MKIILNKGKEEITLRMQDLNHGDFAEIIDTSYTGQIIYISGGFNDGKIKAISLSSPTSVWTPPCTLKVRKLKIGETLTLVK